MESPVVFVVSDDAPVCDSVKELVESAGLQARILPSLQAFLDVVGPEDRGCLVFDAKVSDLRDSQRRARLVAACARLQVIVLAEHGDVPMAVYALKAGATDVVQKPYGRPSLLDRIKKALEAGPAARS
jgi:FixJ family two-component response regulator